MTVASLARRLGVAVAEPLVPGHPTLGDAHKAELRTRRTAAG
jgi:hypothetical protein